MIPFTIIMILAFTWLGYETDWMRVRLLVGVISIWHDELPYHIGYQDSDFVDADALNWKHTEAEYQAWLDKRYKPKLVYGFRDHAIDYPQYKWQADEEDLRKRRAGEMIYQRGK